MTVENLAVVPVVIGLVEAIKRTGVPSNWSPLVALVFGVIGAFVFPAATLGLTMLSGVTIGLMASGLYSGGKALVSTGSQG